MKWFQIHTNSLYDPKIVKLIKSYGGAGVGVYWAVNVLIAERDADDLTLEHDLEGLGTLLNEPNIKAIVETCLSLKLFTRSKDGLIQNGKIAKYIGNWQKRSKSYAIPTEALQRPYSDPTAKKEEKEEKERKKERIERSKDDQSAPLPLQLLWKEEIQIREMLKNPKYGTEQLKAIKSNLNLNLKKQTQYQNTNFKTLREAL